MNIPFIKMHGLGNDFVIIDLTDKNFIINKDIIIKISSRRLGVGCDQLLIIKKLDNYNFLHIYNSNGSEVTACGNGVRCVASYLMDKSKKNKISIMTKENLINCWKDEDEICVNMGKPNFNLGRILSKKYSINEDFFLEGFRLNFVSFGNPHAVIFVENIDRLEDIDIEKIGSKIEKNSIFSNGINVEFACILENDSIRMRVWERGAGITMACGTGACATLVIANILKKSKRKNIIVLDGGKLQVNWENNDDVIMRGPVATVFKGDYYERRY